MDKTKLLWLLPIAFILIIGTTFVLGFSELTRMKLDYKIDCFNIKLEEVQFTCDEKPPLLLDDYSVYRTACYLSPERTHDYGGIEYGCALPKEIDEYIQWRIVDCHSENNQEEANQKCLERLENLPEDMREKIQIIWRTKLNLEVQL